MKKKLILPIALLVGTCLSCSPTTVYSVHEYRTTMKFHDDFKVMQLCDLHLGVQGDLARNLKFVENSIKDADPDLIVLTGDQFMFGSKGIVNELFLTLNNVCKELTSTHPDKVTKFAFTFGNHDSHGEYHKYYINHTIKKYVTEEGKEIEDNKYAAFLDYDDDNLTGLANYYIDLVDDIDKDKDEVDVKYRIHIIDSNDYHYVGPFYKYEVIQEDQLNHINNIYNTATKDKDYVGLAFFHIPFYEFEEAKSQYLNASDPSLIGQGVFNEGVGDSYYNNNAFETMRESNIVSYFVGHDHINYCDIIYNAHSDDIKEKAIFSYGVKSTDQIYHNSDILGYKLINLKDNMTNEKFIDISNINGNFKNVTDRGSNYDNQ